MKQHLLISIDCIVDTRIWAVNELNPKAALDITSTKQKIEKYVTRVTDSFPEYGITYDDFRAKYRKRDINALLNGAPTAFMLELHKILSAIFDLKVNEPHKVEAIEIHLNTYPYNLTEEEKEDWLDVVSAYIKYPIPVKCVCMSPSTISPHMLKNSDYSALFLYDFEEWVSYHYGLLCTDNPDIYMPQVSVHAPFGFISKEKMKVATELTNPKGETTNPEETTIFTFRRYFAYEPYPFGLFSMIHPDQLAYYLTEK